MKNIKNILLVGFTLISASCTERIDIDLDTTSTRCVIYGEITTDTTFHKVMISRTGDYFGQKPAEGISGVQVTIFDGENTFILTETDTLQGLYVTQPDVYGVPGRTYTLSVSNVDLLGDGVMRNFQASSELRPVAEPDSINVIYRKDWQGWVVQAWATDPAETKDFYMFHTYINGQLDTDTLRSIVVTDDQFFNGSQTNGVVIAYLFGEEALAVSDTVTAAFCGITEDYYKYITEAQTTARPSSPLFSSAPANPRTNFNNDALGYFAAYSVSRATKIVE